MKRIGKILTDRNVRFSYLSKLGLTKWMKDEAFLKKKYRLIFGEKLDLENPETFNEKMQWLKLHDRKEIYTVMADKYEVKEYVEKKVGRKYVIPLIGVYNSFDDIVFDDLPNQFVIKTTHDSSGAVICKDKAKFDAKTAKKKINKSLRRNYYYSCREWPYKNVLPRIIVEKYVRDDLTEDLRDYKFLCFNGEPRYVYVTVKNDNIFENYYNMNFQPIRISHGFPRSEIDFKKPELFHEMKKVARELSKGTAFLRVDLHYAQGKVLFGEMTFYDWAGFRPFESKEIDKQLGDLIDLDRIKVKL